MLIQDMFKEKLSKLSVLRFDENLENLSRYHCVDFAKESLICLEKILKQTQVLPTQSNFENKTEYKSSKIKQIQTVSIQSNLESNIEHKSNKISVKNILLILSLLTSLYCLFF